MGLLLENEADCLSHQHKHRRHCPVIRCQRRERSPIPRERFSPFSHCGRWSSGHCEATDRRFSAVRAIVAPNVGVDASD